MKYALKKPAFRAPCNGCGFCCAAQVCEVGMDAFNPTTGGGPCPALEFNEVYEQFYCGLVLNPSYYVKTPPKEFNPPHYDLIEGMNNAVRIGVGQGCQVEDSND